MVLGRSGQTPRRFTARLEKVAYGGKPRGCHLNSFQVLESPAQDHLRNYFRRCTFPQGNADQERQEAGVKSGLQ